jgi:rare lipoprotein A
MMMLPAIRVPLAPGMTAAAARIGACLLMLALAACSGSSRREPAVSDTGAATTGGRPSSLYKIGKPYKIKGIWYYPQLDYDYVEEGVASWYGPGFHGQATANGEVYDQNDLTAAHRTLPLPSVVTVTNLDNGRSLKVRINDRGPFARNRIIDLSRRGAQLLGFYGAGTANVRVQIEAEESKQIALALTGTAYPDQAMLASRRARPAALPVAVAPAPEPAPVAVIAETPLATELESQATTPPPTVELPAEPPALAAVVPTDDAAPGVAMAVEPEAVPAPALAAEVVEVADASYPTAALSYPDPSQAAPAASGVDTGSALEAQQPPLTPIAHTTTAGAHAARPEKAYVQAGAFANPVNADRVRVRLATLGPVGVTSEWIRGRDLYKVRLGPLPVGEAERKLTQVIAAGFPGSRVIVE